MTARILVVDDIPANLRLLEARLKAEYYDVKTATSGAEALETCLIDRIDLVLLDVMMPDMDGFEVCERLKADISTHDIPVVMITALDGTAERIRGLEAGADDFLTKPANDLQLMTRVKSLLRLKALSDELRIRNTSTHNIVGGLISSPLSDSGKIAKILLIEENGKAAQHLMDALGTRASVTRAKTAFDGLAETRYEDFECIIVSSGYNNHDPLQLCGQLRTLDKTRLVPIILIAEARDEALLLRGLDLGVNDYITRPVDPQELLARMATQVKRKRYNDSLRATVTETIHMAITDSLTGLHNRRYLDIHLATLLARAQSQSRPLSILITDLDRFKSINDQYGHDAGDQVLREFAKRLRRNIRGMDLACRYGGEEFVIVMPDTECRAAEAVAERIRGDISDEPFELTGRHMVDATISVGVAEAQASDDVASFFKRADKALYQAKFAGRNRVVADLVKALYT